MKFSIFGISFLSAYVSVSAEVYFKEQFNDESWAERWTESTTWKPKSEMGSWTLTAGTHYADHNDAGIKTTEDARFFGISAALEKPYSSADKDLVIQYTIKSDQDSFDCGGAYIKLLTGGDKFDSAAFGGEAPYAVMFGPDQCGSTKRTHVILNADKKEENVMIKRDIPADLRNQKTVLYTLVIRSDNTFEVLVDNKSVRTGALDDEFDFLEEKEISDPDVSRPDDWVDERQIPDPESVKPEGYDDIPAEIPDPTATKPDDWDDEDDGEWEAPMNDNPDYEGPWSPKMMPNPDYKGPWVHPKIPNPDYVFDDKLYAVCSEPCTHIGFELWQVAAGSIFDDIIVTDSLEEAQKFAEESFFPKRDAEAVMVEEEEKKKLEEMDNEEDMDDDYDDHDEF